MNSKARLQTKIGDTLGADKSKMEEEKYNKEGERRSGGKVMTSYANELRIGVCLIEKLFNRLKFFR